MFSASIVDCHVDNGAKTWVWEEFGGEAMEEDYQLASKKFWQTVPAPQKGEAVLCQHCAGGELLTSTEDGRTVEGNIGPTLVTKDLLNPTDHAFH
ncbi:hypothetical protein L3Q82_000230 [Scortum barcoo]|uniref:Uncharacterized protein n=1 Tax=Scortum barcoo TaxID=214431 RepID=A0ACB8XAV6_9TELE|nr:hypothetical protein L3Q82_000230 [Scortum barcoo]